MAALLVCLLVMPTSACRAQAVDPGLVGTWQLRTAGGTMTWEIRADGTYQIIANGAVMHAGTFRASSGQWTLRSATWGDDGGTYRLADTNTFVGTGKLGPATWVRIGAARTPAAATATTAAATAPGGGLVLSTRTVDGQSVPRDLPELMAAATTRARAWKPDAVPVALNFEELDVPNPDMRGPQVKISFLSRSTAGGFQITVNRKGSSTFEFRQRVNWGTQPLPPVFVDLPAANQIARKHGMRGLLKSADLRVWNPSRKSPILAWMVHPAGASGKTLNGANGELIEFDVTGYIDSYNAQSERAARALRALLHSGSRNHGSPIHFGGGAESSSSPEAAADVYTDEDYRREVAEDAAYWSGTPGDYDRIKSGECSWSDNSSYGC